MRKALLLLSLFLLAVRPVFPRPDTITVSDNLEIVRLSERVYLYISYIEIESWGRVGANGLLLVENGQVMMIDTPWDNPLTEELDKWIREELRATVKTVVPTHWHEDCMGGLGYLHSKGVNSYAGQKTIDIAMQNNLPAPRNGFADSLSIDFQSIPVQCYYLGAGHTADLIAVWLPGEDILFAGDLVKDINATSLGNMADADVGAWPYTLRRMAKKFSAVKTVIPGHGDPGGADLILHTIRLLEK